MGLFLLEFRTPTEKAGKYYVVHLDSQLNGLLDDLRLILVLILSILIVIRVQVLFWIVAVPFPPLDLGFVLCEVLLHSWVKVGHHRW